MILFGRFVDVKGWVRRRLRLPQGEGKVRKPKLRWENRRVEQGGAYRQTAEQKIVTLLLASFLLGIVGMNLCGSRIVERFEMLSADGLIALRDAVIDGKLFFKQLLLRRGMILCGIIGASAIRPGKWILRGVMVWLGFALGSFFAALSLLYGLKGQLLGLVWCLPQGIAYVPAFIFLMKWCGEFHEMIYTTEHLLIRSAEGRRAFAWKSAEFAGILCLLFVGCLLEGYLNPIFLQFCLCNF